LAGRYEDAETLTLLTKRAAASSEPGAIELLRVDRMGGMQNTPVYPSALGARFVSGLPASSLLIVGPVDSGNAQIGSKYAPISLLAVAPETHGVANGGQLAVAVLANGSVDVRDRDGILVMNKSGSLPDRCPQAFTAYNPDICQTKHATDVSVHSPQRVLGATVIFAKGAPWLVTVSAESRAVCHLVTRSACFETRPCSCDYELVERDFRSTLELTRIDLPALSYRVDLGVFQDADLKLEASDGGDVADFAVAIARHDQKHVFVDYLLIRGQ